MTSANLTGAEVRGANFGRNGGGSITLIQLYSTASYHLNPFATRFRVMSAKVKNLRPAEYGV